MKGSRFIAGKNPVLEAVLSGVSIDKVFIQRDKRGKPVSQIVEACKDHGIPFQYVPPEKIKRILGPKQKNQQLNHQGVLAISSLIQYYKVEDIISFLQDKGKLPFFCILDRVTDVRNFGAIARSAVAFGVDAIIVPKKYSADVNEFAVKASAGALEKIHICRVDRLEDTIKTLKLNGLTILAADMNGTSIDKIPVKDIPFTIIMGSEGEGISKKLLKHADEIVSIPISKDIESLNVSVAAGLFFYELSRKRKIN